MTFSFLTRGRTPKLIALEIATTPIAQREAQADKLLAGLSRTDREKVTAAVKPMLPVTFSAKAIAAVLEGPDSLIDGALVALHRDALVARDVPALDLINHHLRDRQAKHDADAKAAQGLQEAAKARRAAAQAEGDRVRAEGQAEAKRRLQARINARLGFPAR